MPRGGTRSSKRKLKKHEETQETAEAMPNQSGKKKGKKRKLDLCEDNRETSAGFETWENCKSIEDILTQLKSKYTSEFITKVRSFYLEGIREIFEKSRKNKKVKRDVIPPFLKDFHNIDGMLGLIDRARGVLESDINKRRENESKIQVELQKEKVEKERVNKEYQQLQEAKNIR